MNMGLINKVLTSKISRRDFLKSSAAIGAAGMALAVSGCNTASNDLEETGTTVPNETTAAATTQAATEATTEAAADPVAPVDDGGKWVAAACWHNCGGKCLVKAYVKDGVIMRQKTDDIYSDDEVNRQQRACLRGYSQQYQARGLDRLKYPMKRKNWTPGDPHGELRGIDEWERISWDEAAQYIHDELERISTTYGDNAILVNGGEPTALLNKIGRAHV